MFEIVVTAVLVGLIVQVWRVMFPGKPGQPMVTWVEVSNEGLAPDEKLPGTSWVLTKIEGEE